MDLLEEGIAHLRQERYADAIQCLQVVLESDPQNEQALLYLGQAHMKLRDYAAAERYARRLVELLPDNAMAWCNLGVALRKLRRFEEAKEAQEKALVLRPGHEKAQSELRKIGRDIRREARTLVVDVPPTPAASPATPEQQALPEESPPTQRRTSRRMVMGLAAAAVALVLVIGLFVVSALLKKGDTKPEGTVPATESTLPTEIPVPTPQPQLSYRERKALGLLTEEELQQEQELQEIEKQIGEARRQEHEDFQRRQEVSAASASKSGSYAVSARGAQRGPTYTTGNTEYQELIRGGWSPEQAARIIDRAKEMGRRREARKDRWQRGLPTQPPSYWERVMGYADRDPW